MHELGVLSRNTTIAHSVWVSDADIALMGDVGVSIAHNAVSNQKRGASIAPIRRLLDAGVTVELGTDGVCSNDTARIFDVMRTAGLIHSVPSADPSQWLGAEDILMMVTIGGARTTMLEQVMGSLEAGKAADLLLLDLNSYSFAPNDVAKHLAFAENGSSIELVMVGGRVVFEDGKLTTVDEAAILHEIRERVPAYLAVHTQMEARNAVFEPYFAELHRRATQQDIGLFRYGGDMQPYRNSNRRNFPS